MDFTAQRQELLRKTRSYLPEHITRLSWTKDELSAWRLSALRRMLSHAKNNTVYYRQLLKDIDTDRFQLNDLVDIPITTKQNTVDHWDDFIANQVITKQEAEKHLQDFRDGKIQNPYYKNQYLFFATGGSSGHRGLFMYTNEHAAHFICSAFRLQIKDEAASGKHVTKMAAIVAPSWLHASVPIFTTSVRDDIEVKHFFAEMPMDRLIKELEAFQPDQLIGYSSVIIELSSLANYGKLHIKPFRVSTNSEPLDDEGRDSIRHAWGVEVNNGWGCVEGGMLGVEDDRHLGLWVPNDMVILEPVDEQLQAVTNPQDTRKLLITNLFNFSFPLIRYVVDDAVTIRKRDDSVFEIVEEIQGRADDWFVYDDNIKIHPMVFRGVLGQDSRIFEYQVEQTKDGAKVRLVSVSSIDTKEIKQRLIRNLTEAGLLNPVIHVTQLPELPRHSETGKLKRFIALK